MANEYISITHGNNNVYIKEPIKSTSFTLLNSWQSNGFEVFRIGDIVIINLNVRHGTAMKVCDIPYGYRPISSKLYPISDYERAGYALAYTDRIEVSLYHSSISITGILIWITNDNFPS